MTARAAVLKWLISWVERKGLEHWWYLDSAHVAWRDYWRFCARNGLAPLKLRPWAKEIAKISNGCAYYQEHEDEFGCSGLFTAPIESMRSILWPQVNARRSQRSRRK